MLTFEERMNLKPDPQPHSHRGTMKKSLNLDDMRAIAHENYSNDCGSRDRARQNISGCGTVSVGGGVIKDDDHQRSHKLITFDGGMTF